MTDVDEKRNLQNSKRNVNDAQNLRKEKAIDEKQQNHQNLEDVTEQENLEGMVNDDY